MSVLSTLFYFILAIGLLVSIHEFGHFWVARKTGVKVLRFSIGFGKVLWSHQKNTQDTEYVISAIPLGGYVKMVDEREGEVKPEDLPFAFNRQALWVRTAIVAAGPLFNLLLAVVLFWGALVIGEVGVKPVLGKIEAGTLAAEAGFSEGDQILSINNEITPTWSEVLDAIFSAAMDGEQVFSIKVKMTDDSEKSHRLVITEAEARNPQSLHQRLGFTPWTPTLKPIIGKVIADSPAAQAGLQTGDLLISADNIALNDWLQWVNYVQHHPTVAIRLVIERNDVRQTLQITPRAEDYEGKVVGKIGAAPYVPENLLASMQVTRSLSPWAAVPVAFERTWFYSASTLKMMFKMLIGQASTDNLGGPISIAQYAGKSAEMGVVAFLKYLALVSVSLGVLNLLPVPVLDGGHLLFFAIEAVRGGPLTDKLQLHFQQFGMVLLGLLMMFAMFLDIGRWLN